jgi:hypothetical protein
MQSAISGSGWGLAKQRFRIVLVLASLGLACWPAAAQITLIGFVKTVSPDAEMVLDGQTFKAQVGMPLQSGFRIRTGAQGSLGISLRDNTLISFGPNSEFALDEYQYAPAKEELKLSGSMFRGTMQYVSGFIAKLRPDSVTIKTPKGVLGLRGTRVLLQVDEANP